MACSPAVVAVGLNCSAGSNAEESFRSAFLGNDALQKLSLFKSPRHSERFVAQADLKNSKRLSRCTQMLYLALDEAFEKIDLKQISADRISVWLGTSIGGIFETENMLIESRQTGEKNFSALSTYECSTLAEIVSKRIKAKGECTVFSTACSSSSLAIADACNAIVQGDCDVAVVCGADALSRITVNGFGSLLLLSDKKCSPFDKNRNGINLGEAGGVMVICSDAIVRKLGLKPLAYLSGWACSCDAYHATAPHPTGDGAFDAFKKSLEKSGMNAGSITHYIAHGTATQGNDTSEASAMKNFFGEDCLPTFSSIKRIFGHTLGASGIVNAILSVKAIVSGKLPKNSGFETIDENIGIAPLTESKTLDVENILSASLGFGGNNGVSLFSKYPKNIKDFNKKRLFVYGVSLLGNGGIFPDAELLKEISPLKKRKWAHLQKMGLQTAKEAMQDIVPNVQGDKIAVCWGTGLGMTSQTASFIENVIDKNEAEPMPTAFTNSVHNAVSSLIAVQSGYKGLNSATTAKEISFESALLQAMREIYSGDALASIVGSADEYSHYASDFLASRSAKYSRADSSKVSDFSVAYFIGDEQCCDRTPLAEILTVDIARRAYNVELETNRIVRLLKANGLSLESISYWSMLDCVNNFQEKWMSALSEKLGVCEFAKPFGKYGTNYSVSGASIFESLSEKGKTCVHYSLSSTNMSAITIFKVL